MERRFIGQPPVETPENFAEHPETISEARAHKTRQARDWTPRDALINMLRDIDSGKTSVSDLVICFRECPKDGKDEDAVYGYANACDRNDVALSVVARTQYMLLRSCCDD